jgi:acetyltransferase-like isoleucine patch superfamily enzyme
MGATKDSLGQRKEPKREDLYIQKKLFAEDKSPLEKYQELIIGKPGILNLIKYELVMLVASWVPGVLGLVLRQKLYRRLLGRAGKGVVFGRNVVLRHPHKIYLGDNVVVDENCVLDAKGTDDKGTVLGDGVFIGRNTIVDCKNGDINIDKGSNISFNCQVFSANFVNLGKNVLIAAYTFLNGGSHNFERLDIPVMEQERCGKGLVVEDGVWLGAGVKVMDGVTIGKDAIVGAGAVVIRDVSALGIAGGVPARLIRMRTDAEPGP